MVRVLLSTMICPAGFRDPGAGTYHRQVGAHHVADVCSRISSCICVIKRLQWLLNRSRTIIQTSICLATRCSSARLALEGQRNS